MPNPNAPGKTGSLGQLQQILIRNSPIKPLKGQKNKNENNFATTPSVQRDSTEAMQESNDGSQEVAGGAYGVNRTIGAGVPLTTVYSARHQSNDKNHGQSYANQASTSVITDTSANYMIESSSGAATGVRSRFVNQGFLTKARMQNDIFKIPLKFKGS